jgi:hypothetical protein
MAFVYLVSVCGTLVDTFERLFEQKRKN